MNILSIENKFKALDEKERKVRQYFNPKILRGKKHHYIADIRADFHYDTLLYGLGQFWLQDSDSDGSFESHNELKGEILKIPIKKTSQKPKSKSPLLAKRKNVALLNLQKPLTKDHYEGIFSDTKVLNHDYLYKKPIASFGKSGWKTAATGERTVRNKAARGEMMYSSRVPDFNAELRDRIERNKCDSPHKLKNFPEAKISKEEFKSYLEEFKQLIFTGKEPLKFQLDLGSLRQVPAEKPQKIEAPKLFQIIFQNSPVIIVKSINEKLSLSFTDISTSDFLTQHYQNLVTCEGVVQGNAGKEFEMTGIFGEVKKHTIRVLIQGEKENLDYYVSIQEHKESLEEKVKNEIIQYKLVIYEAIRSKGQRDIVPLNLEKIAKIAKPVQKKNYLPQIQSYNKPPVKKKDYSNPLTSALFTYKKTTESFHPQAYPANLAIFEAHDFIEENYAAVQRPKPAIQKVKIELGVNGFGLSNSFL